MRKPSVFDWIAIILVVIGGLNWGLVGLFNFDIVAAIFGMSILSNIIYILVAIAAVYVLVMAMKANKGGQMPM